MINHLRSLGIQIALDDFGTGFSSLSHLKDFPIDSLKIDQTFVKNIKNDTTSATIVKAILGMAESMGITTVCEGIESREQFEILKQTTCDMAQGYLFLHSPVSGRVCQKIPNPRKDLPDSTG